MNLEMINAAANRDMSNFDGNNYDPNNQPNLRRYTGYTGFGDDLVDFDGKAVGFAAALATNRVFTIVLDNTGANNVNRTVLICPSYAPTLGGNRVIMADGVIAAGLTGLGDPETIANFLAFINLNPTSVVAMRLQSNLSGQLQTTISLVRKSPFKKLETESINIGSFVSETNSNDKLVTVNRPFQMDNQSEIAIPILAGASVTITLFCGAVLNTAAALNQKFQKAAMTAQSGQ